MVSCGSLCMECTSVHAHKKHLLFISMFVPVQKRINCLFYYIPCISSSICVPSSCVSDESLSSVGMSSLSLKSREGEDTGPRCPSADSRLLSSVNKGNVKSSGSGRHSVYSSGAMANCNQQRALLNTQTTTC